MAWADHLTAVVRDERFVLAVIGLATFSTVAGMVKALAIIRDDNELPPPTPKSQYITQDTEDALQLGTIEKLMDHPSYAIKEVVDKILLDRALNDPGVLRVLQEGIQRPSYDDRIKALRALWVLTGPASAIDSLAKLHTTQVYTAFIRSLEIGLSDSPLPEVSDPQWDEFNLRDMPERLILTFLSELTTKYTAHKLIKAGFVKKWLVKQAWGATSHDRIANFARYIDYRRNRLVVILERIKQTRTGLRALEKAGLIDQEFSRMESGEAMRGLVRETPGPEAQVVLEVEAWDGGEDGGNVLRVREHSAEEQRLRRQHREAMVLNDGISPLGRQDIIERDRRSEA